MSARAPALAAGPDVECDVLVIGSGAGGLACAVTAAARGLDVVVAEKAPVFGGTTAWSGGWLWIPGNPLAVRAGLDADLATARDYLVAELGEHFDAERVDIYLSAGPRMVEFFERQTDVQFIAGLTTPDFHAESKGASVGRVICAAPFDGRKLGAMLTKLRPPLPELTLGGLAVAAGADLGHFMQATRSLRSFIHVAQRVAGHGLSLARSGRNLHLVNGNALAARLMKSALDRQVRLWNGAPARRLMFRNARVCGAILERDARQIRVEAKRGVVLACGGFPHDVERCARLFGDRRSGREHRPVAPPENTGDGLALAESAGAALETSLHHPAAWAPVSIVRHDDGREGVFPHLVDRARPGVIAVVADGSRFVNEACSYHDFVAALLATTPAGSEAAAHLVVDHRALRRYGLGFAKPFPLPLGPYLRSGYLQCGATFAALAQAAGIDAQGLEATIAGYNRGARDGRDDAFGRGSTPFDRFGGDARHPLNPCVAPIDQPPFYAVKVLPGSLGTFAGVKTDALSRALDADGIPVDGLFVVGNDAASIMGGNYPSGGITLGPAMTFGYLVGRYLAGGERALGLSTRPVYTPRAKRKGARR